MPLKKLEDLGTTIDADILIIGGGIAGHTFAITANAKRPELKVLLVEKATAGRTGPSALVGGRYTAFLPETDDFDRYFRDTVEEKDYLCDQEKIEDYLNKSGEVFRSLETWGVRFVKKPEGGYDRPLSRGEASGMLLDGGGIPAMKALNDSARRVGVEFHNHIMMTGLLARQGQVVGAVGFHVRTGGFYVFRAKATVLATGMTRFKTIQPGHRNDTGDGYAMASSGGSERGTSDIMCFEVDGLEVCHMAHGDLGHALSQEQLATLGQVDVLLPCRSAVSQRWTGRGNGSARADQVPAVHPDALQDPKVSLDFANVDGFLEGKEDVVKVEGSEVTLQREKPA